MDRLPNIRNATFKKEAERLKTFETWPKKDVVSPELLALDGFIYLLEGDMVQCVFCELKLRAWEPGCTPSLDHGRYNPNCPFILGYDVGNVPANRDHRRVATLGLYDSSSTHGRSDTTSPEEQASVPRIKAVTPQMAPRTVRHDTFNSWTGGIAHVKLVNDLVDAGFYFIAGRGDQVKCFCCDGCLEQWTATDEPWLEHAKWFPTCEYLKISKGDEYIAKVQATHAGKDTSGASASSRSGPRPVVTFPVDPREVRARLDTPRVRNLLAAGYSVAELTLAIEQRLRTSGNDFTTLPEFINALEAVRKANSSSSSGAATARSTASIPAGVSTSGATFGAAAANEVAGASGAAAAAAAPLRKKKQKKQSAAEEQQMANESEVRAAVEDGRLLREARQCKVCLDEQITVVFLPCGHACTCAGCAATVSHCPLCRHFIRGTVKINLEVPRVT